MTRLQTLQARVEELEELVHRCTCSRGKGVEGDEMVGEIGVGGAGRDISVDSDVREEEYAHIGGEVVSIVSSGDSIRVDAEAGPEGRTCSAADVCGDRVEVRESADVGGGVEVGASMGVSVDQKEGKRPVLTSSYAQTVLKGLDRVRLGKKPVLTTSHAQTVVKGLELVQMGPIRESRSTGEKGTALVAQDGVWKHEGGSRFWRPSAAGSEAVARANRDEGVWVMKGSSRIWRRLGDRAQGQENGKKSRMGVGGTNIERFLRLDFQTGSVYLSHRLRVSKSIQKRSDI